MKQLLLILNIILFTKVVYMAQQFVTTDNKWIINHTYELTSGEKDNAPFFFWFKDEVELDNQSYLQLNKAKIGGTGTIALEAYYREEAGIVYRYNSTGEIVLYDFNNDLGDVLILGENQREAVIESTESVKLLDGTMSKVSNLGLPFRDYQLIGQMGLNINPFDPTEADEDRICCFFKSGKLAYSFNSLDSSSKNFPCSNYDPSYAENKFVSRDNEWIVFGVSHFPNSGPGESKSLTFEEEVLIDGQLYFEIEGLRYREEGDKIYRYNHDGESLVFDFGLSEGDTFRYIDSFKDQFWIVDCIDELILEDGSTTEVFHLSENDSDRRNLLIADIGLIKWHIMPFHYFTTDYSETLSKFYRNGELVYNASICDYECAAKENNFVRTDNVWVTNETYWDADQQAEVSHKVIYTLRDEVVLSGLKYLRLHVSRPALGTSSFILGPNVFREIYDNRVDQAGTVLYDFNLELGETVSFHNAEDLEVFAIDTIELLDGSTVRQYALQVISNPMEDLYRLIEGIGLNYSPLMPSQYADPDRTEQLLCFYQNGKLKYQVSDDSYCEPFLSEVSEESINPVSLSYSDHRIFINGIETNNGLLLLYNTNGQLVQNARISSGTIQVDPSLATGLYVCQLVTTNKVVHVQTVIIH